MWPCKNISHITVLVTNCFPTPPIKLKLGQRVEERLLIATHLDQSNYLANQKQGAVNKYDLTVFISLFDGSSRALKSCTCFQGPSFLPVDPLDLNIEPHPRLPVQGHILSWWGCSNPFFAGMRQVYIYYWNWYEADICLIFTSGPYKASIASGHVISLLGSLIPGSIPGACFIPSQCWYIPVLGGYPVWPVRA
jgi:hypothetical protein